VLSTGRCVGAAGDVARDPEVAELPGEVRLSGAQFEQCRDGHDQDGNGEVGDGQTDDEVVGDGAETTVADHGGVHGDRASRRVRLGLKRCDQNTRRESPRPSLFWIKITQLVELVAVSSV